MKNKIRSFLSGRQGMDELSKALFWGGLICTVLSVFLAAVLNGVFGRLFSWFGTVMLLLCFIRAFSRRLGQREAENNAFLAFKAKRSRAFAAFKDRRKQSKDFRFFKCPGCGTYLRVPRGKGKIHIACKCGYTLYRRT